MNEKIAFIICFLIAINAAFPIALLILEVLLKYWSRGALYKKLTISLQCKKWDFIFSEGKCFDETDAFFSWLIVDLLSGIILALILTPLTINFGLTPFFILAAIIAFIILPRYLYDVKTALKYNIKSRESERIAELEKRIDKLSR